MILRYPLDIALYVGLIFVSLVLLAWVWPYLKPPSPVPIAEEIVRDIKAQEYGLVYWHLTRRHQRVPVDEYVRANKSAEEPFFRFGAFIEDTFVDRDAASYGWGEAYVPVYYKVRIVSTRPPKTRISMQIFKLVMERREWRLDGIKVIE